MMMLFKRAVRSVFVNKSLIKSFFVTVFLVTPVIGFCEQEVNEIINQISGSHLSRYDVLVIAINVSILLLIFFGFRSWRLKQKLLENDLASQELIWHQANFDALTDLPNRRMFQEKLSSAVDRANQSGRLVALLLLDLDGFKQVNDSLGHSTGDMLLKEVGRRIKGCLYSDDTVARLGGDEFTVIVENIWQVSHVEKISNKILTTLNRPFLLGEHTIHISTSIGITLYPTDTSDTDTLLKNADQAMYAAKSLGKNCYQFFTVDMQKNIEAKIKIMHDLRSALAKDEFELYYQPIIELSSKEVVKAEALIRWMHPNKGCISPLDFIPVIEESGLIVPIGDWAFLQATQFLQHVQQHHNKQFQISINVSPKQFQQANGISVSDQSQFWITKNAVEGIIIEITEGLVLDLTDEVKTQLDQIRDAGIETAIDDFGTGYSSLAYLKKFHIDYIKIDRSFVSNIESDSNDRVLCEVIIEMAHKLGFKVVAEGIETKAQLDFLMKIGCDYGQGFYFAKPLPKTEFIEYIANT